MSSIPLPALAARAPQSDPLEQLARVAQLKAAQQQLQGGQLENQQREMQIQQQQRMLQDQQTINQAISSRPGATLHDILPSLAGRIAPDSFLKMQNADRQMQEQVRKATKEDLDNAQAQHGMYQQIYNNVMNLPDEQVQAEWPQIVQAISEVPGNKIQLNPQQPLTKQQLQQFGPMLSLNEAYLQNETAKRKGAADVAKSEAETAKAQAQTAMIGKKPGEDVPYAPDVFAQKKALKTNINMTTQDDLDNVVQGILSGQAPPDIRDYSFRDRTAIAGRLSKQGFNLSQATNDWKATQRYLTTLNGSQQVRLRQAIGALPELADKIEGLYNEWGNLAHSSGYRVLNKATLAAMKQLPGRPGAVAQALDAQIADAVSDLAVVYMGGNSPTDHGLDLAKKNLSADWNDETFKEGLKQLRANVQIRANSIQNAGVAGASEGNPYAPPKQQQGAPQAQPLTVTAPNDKTYTFKDQASADAFRQAAGIR